MPQTPGPVLGSFLLAGAVTFAAALPPQENGQEAASLSDGVYTAPQAERGQLVYDDACVVCHQPEEFTHPTYLASWKGRTVYDLFESIRNTMPEDNPGGLRRQEYADMLAYLFKLNGLPAGETEMSGAADALKLITIDGPPSDPAPPPPGPPPAAGPVAAP